MRNNSYDIRNYNDRFFTGVVMIVVGGAILLKRLGVPFPGWLYDWSAIVILIGLISGIKVRFKGVSWIIIMSIGVFFMLDEVVRDKNIRPYIWPALIIGIGLILLFRPKRKTINIQDVEEGLPPAVIETKPYDTEVNMAIDDYIDCTSVFGEVKKMVTSKSFKGGEIVCFMGGSQINLTQADIHGPIFLEVTIVFGGTKIVVPPNWEVRSESVAVFAGIEDKRNLLPGSRFDPNKILIIKGTSVFGGIEIKSF
jgi:hypothetical protein